MIRNFLILILVLIFVSCSNQPLVESNPQLTQIENSSTNLSVEIWTQNLDIPWDIEFINNNLALVTQRPGIISLIKNGKIIQKNYYSVDEVIARGESGLMGLTKHPQFPEKPYIYVMYTYSKNNELYNKVVRLKHLNTTAIFDKIIIDNILGARYHDGGRIEFGPDDKLYITTGDAGNPDLSQDLTSLNGKILRLNPDGSIPKNNPFNNPIYSYGHRNPQGLAWQPSTNILFASEHGPSGDLGRFAHDEINIIEKGKNYGWPKIVGRSENKNYSNPLVLWSDSAVPPAGMDFYNSSLYLATLKTQTLYQINLDENNDVISITKLLKDQYGRLRDVKVHNGYLYILTSNKDSRGNINLGDDKILKIKIT